jgi:probable F420-dependent oxidoreductase
MLMAVSLPSGTDLGERGRAAMLVDATLDGAIESIADQSAAAEAQGYDGVWVAEVARDPFLPLVTAAANTQRVTLGTSIAVAFARNPMTLAVVANDLHRASQGRFVLGLGSQIEPHITKRFSMPWSHPADRMREMVDALRAIWRCWNEGAPLAFEGTYYRHTLMTPFFNPGANPYGEPPVYLAAVGPRMTAVAGAVADGLFVHPFTTQRYLDEVTLPALDKALAAAGRQRSDITICLPAFVVAGEDDERLEAAAARTRQQIAFYASTPAYRRVLDLHGWGDLQPRLNALSKQGQWTQMAEAIDDEVLHTFAAVGTTEQAAAELRRRYDGIVDRLSFATQDGSAVPEGLRAAVRAEA